MKSELIPRQQEILDFTANHIHTVGIAPSVREIMARFKIRSSHGVRTHLQAIERKGGIRLLPNKARGIVLVEHNSKDRFIRDLYHEWKNGSLTPELTNLMCKIVVNV